MTTWIRASLLLEMSEKLYREENDNKFNTQAQPAKKRAKSGFLHALELKWGIQIPLLAQSLAG
jgi:hypothetical protein